jgi:signal transduction histidine kinase
LSIQRLSPTVYTEIDLDVLIRKMIGLLASEIKETNAMIESTLRVRTIFSLGPYIESIFLNLISNAIKYRHPGRQPKLKITSIAQNGHLQLRFEDNGIGIDLQKHGQNLFSLYKRFHFHVEGKGLGLFLVRTQVEALGGTVTVNSEIDHGTTFEILFPQHSDKLDVS